MKLWIAALFSVCVLLVTPSADAQSTLSCSPVNVASFSNRVHVQCNVGAGSIVFFAVPTSNVSIAERFMDLALAGLINGKTLTILYNPADTTGPTFGCASSNCRPAQAILINK